METFIFPQSSLQSEKDQHRHIPVAFCSFDQGTRLLPVEKIVSRTFDLFLPRDLQTGIDHNMAVRSQPSGKTREDSKLLDRCILIRVKRQPSLDTLDSNLCRVLDLKIAAEGSEPDALIDCPSFSLELGDNTMLPILFDQLSDIVFPIDIGEGIGENLVSNLDGFDLVVCSERDAMLLAVYCKAKPEGLPSFINAFHCVLKVCAKVGKISTNCNT